MAYDAKVIQVMIASPSDVSEERKVVRDVIDEWNTVHSSDRNVVLMAVGWETHTSPELAGRPQQVINERLLDSSDLLVGIFWTRVGSPTGKAISGSVEEIEEHLKRGKPVMLYFSDVPVRPDSVDSDQYEKLLQFRKWAMERGLVERYESMDDFRRKFRRQLPLTLRDNEYLRNLASRSKDRVGALLLEEAPPPPSRVRLGPDSMELLKAAADDPDATIIVAEYIGGTDIEAGSRKFADPTDRRSVARWEAAVEELARHGYIKDLSGKGEVFEVTHSGYQLLG